MSVTSAELIGSRATDIRAQTPDIVEGVLPGAVIGAALAIVAFMAYVGFFLRSGLGTTADILACALLGLLGVALIGSAIALIAKALKTWRSLYIGFWFGAATFSVLLFLWFGTRLGLALRMGIALVSVPSVLGAGVAALVRGGGSKPSRGLRIAGAVLTIAATAVCIWFLAWLAGPGIDPYHEIQEVSTPAPIAVPATPNPSLPGDFEFQTLLYGSGHDKRRPEYGKRVALTTQSVDARPFLKKISPLRAALRKWYWGFGPDEFPLNGRVWYPKGDGPFPLVLIVHGNRQMEVSSDSGYAYLGELLASRGYIVCSIDENFFNLSWSGPINGENGVEDAARAWVLLQHLTAWRTWNDTIGNPFYKKVDLSNIALIGHSRGGEAIGLAYAFDKLNYFPDNASTSFHFNFSIKSLIAIEPPDGQYKPADQPPPLENVNFLVFGGSHDSDVYSFAGSRPYNDVKFTDGKYWMKSSIYISRANHSQFNTQWGRYDPGSPFYDQAAPFNHLINEEPILKAEDQRQIAKVYISAFLDATLRGRSEYIPMFRDYHKASEWLPKTAYFSQFRDSRYQVVSNFEDGVDVTRTTAPGGVQSGKNLTVWRQQQVNGRFDSFSYDKEVAVLGWAMHDDILKAEDTPMYSVTLPPDLPQKWKLDKSTRLVFSVADADATDETRRRGPIDFTVELIGTNGTAAKVTIGSFFPLQPLPRVRFTKWDYLDQHYYQSPSEPIFQTYEIPLSAFLDTARSFDLRSLTTIRFCFDRSKSGVIMLSDLGFEPDAGIPARTAN